MRLRTYVTALSLVLVVLLGLSCESTPVTAPTDGQLTVSANPGTVVINVEAGEDSAQSTLIVQMYDASGFAVTGANVAFLTTGGTLESSDNSCSGGTCKQTGESCGTNSDCPAVPPTPIETNASGIAIDVLTLTLPDPTSVDVTATSGSLSSVATVTKTVTEGNTQPTALINATPQDAARVDSPVTFDGRGSSDPDGVITCYQWIIDSDLASFDEVVQGQTTSLVTKPFSVEQNLSVQLWVSDESGAASWCTTYEGPPGDARIAPRERFSPDSASLTYEIVCDTSPPNVSGGDDRLLQLVDDRAEVTLVGTASDPESLITSTNWSCGNNQAIVDGDEVTCVYTFAGVFTARYTAINGCSMDAFDEVEITVEQPIATVH